MPLPAATFCVRGNRWRQFFRNSSFLSSLGNALNDAGKHKRPSSPLGVRDPEASSLPGGSFRVGVTAYDRYALQAFEVNSIDYLLKPIEERHLVRALDKVERLHASSAAAPDWKTMLAQITGALRQQGSGLAAEYPERIASRLGDRIHILDLTKVTHFFAQEKLTYAATEGKNHVVDHTVSDRTETRSASLLPDSSVDTIKSGVGEGTGRVVRRPRAGAAEGRKIDGAASGARAGAGVEKASGRVGQECRSPRTGRFRLPHPESRAV